MTLMFDAEPSDRPSSDRSDVASGECSPSTDVGVDWASVLESARHWKPPRVTTLVVVPHPDDEVLSTGGLISGLRRDGVEVVIAAVTDGEAAYPETDPGELARVRRHEQLGALEFLGVSRSAIHRLGFDDGRVADDESQLEAVIERLIIDCAVEFVVAPWVFDHHTDHEACGRAAQEAARRLGIGSAGGLFWAYQHTDPRKVNPDMMVAVELDLDERAAKSAALRCHKSQTDRAEGASILQGRDLMSAAWECEYFVLSPPSST